MRSQTYQYRPHGIPDGICDVLRLYAEVTSEVAVGQSKVPFPVPLGPPPAAHDERQARFGIAPDWGHPEVCLPAGLCRWRRAQRHLDF